MNKKVPLSLFLEFNNPEREEHRAIYYLSKDRNSKQYPIFFLNK